MRRLSRIKGCSRRSREVKDNIIKDVIPPHSDQRYHPASKPIGCAGLPELQAASSVTCGCGSSLFMVEGSSFQAASFFQSRGAARDP